VSNRVVSEPFGDVDPEDHVLPGIHRLPLDQDRSSDCARLHRRATLPTLYRVTFSAPIRPSLLPLRSSVEAFSQQKHAQIAKLTKRGQESFPGRRRASASGSKPYPLRLCPRNCSPRNCSEGVKTRSGESAAGAAPDRLRNSIARGAGVAVGCIAGQRKRNAPFGASARGCSPQGSSIKLTLHSICRVVKIF
jgi:hypothetical protein